MKRGNAGERRQLSQANSKLHTDARIDIVRPSLVYIWGGKGAQSPDARVLVSALEDKRQGYAFPSMGIEERPSLIQELSARGYDITTLRFTISRKDTPPQPAGADDGIA